MKTTNFKLLILIGGILASGSLHKGFASNDDLKAFDKDGLKGLFSDCVESGKTSGKDIEDEVKLNEAGQAACNLLGKINNSGELKLPKGTQLGVFKLKQEKTFTLLEFARLMKTVEKGGGKGSSNGWLPETGWQWATSLSIGAAVGGLLGYFLPGFLENKVKSENNENE